MSMKHGQGLPCIHTGIAGVASELDGAIVYDYDVFGETEACTLHSATDDVDVVYESAFVATYGDKIRMERR